MPDPRRAALALCFAFSLCSCTEDGVILAVDLRTDYVPGVEFVVAEARIEDGNGALVDSRMSGVLGDADALEGVRVADFLGASPGDRRVSVTLYGADGQVVGRNAVSISFTGNYGVTVLVTRACARVTCGDEESCVDGQCVDPRCSPETPERCGDAVCADATACDAPAASCAEARCVQGACFAAPVAGACGETQVCIPEGGCVERPTLPDASVPADGGVGTPPPFGPRPVRPIRGYDTGRVDAPDPGLPRPHATRPKFVWDSGADEATRFEIELSRDSDLDPVEVVVTQAATELFVITPPAQALSAGRWYWRIRACNDAGCSPPETSEILHFDVGVVPGDIDGDTLADAVVGAPGFNSGFGALHVYPGDAAAGLRFAAEDVRTNPGLVNGNLGRALAVGDLNGDGRAELIGGAPLQRHTGGDVHRGSVFVWTDDASPGISFLGAPDELRSGNPLDDAWFGEALAVPGDFDGDGFDDLVVGEPGVLPEEGTPAPREGRVWVYWGSATGVSSSDKAELVDPLGAAAVGQAFGAAIAGGDFNGDSYMDLAVGAYLAPGGGDGRGAVHVYFGGPDVHGGWDLATRPDLTLTPPGGMDQDKLGFALACVGDVNDDRYDDLVVGAIGRDGGVVDEGVAYLFFGRFDGLSTSDFMTLPTPAGAARFGSAIAPLRDVNGDGDEDFAIAGYASNGDEGGVWLFTAFDTAGVPLTPTAPPVVDGGDQLGRCVGGHDWDGDGLTDVVIGAPETPSGGAWFFTGVEESTPTERRGEETVLDSRYGFACH